MFQLTGEEGQQLLRSQSVTLERGQHRKYLPPCVHRARRRDALQRPAQQASGHRQHRHHAGLRAATRSPRNPQGLGAKDGGPGARAESPGQDDHRRFQGDPEAHRATAGEAEASYRVSSPKEVIPFSPTKKRWTTRVFRVRPIALAHSRAQEGSSCLEIAIRDIQIGFNPSLSIPMAKKPKRSASEQLPIPVQMIERRIYLIRGQKVMFDLDLAELYGEATTRLSQQVQRNMDRFPEGFAFSRKRSSTL